MKKKVDLPIVAEITAVGFMFVSNYATTHGDDKMKITKDNMKSWPHVFLNGSKRNGN